MRPTAPRPPPRRRRRRVAWCLCRRRRGRHAGRDRPRPPGPHRPGHRLRPVRPPARSRSPGEVCHIIGGPIPVERARHLAEDAFINAVLHDGTRIETVAHFGRHINAELRTALELGAPPGFEGAVCEDCGRRYGLQWDHVNPVANHGPTSFANIAARCWPDHHAKTERDRRAGLLTPSPP